MKTIKILHLFPKLLSLYGEYGNVKVLASTLWKGGWEVLVDSMEEVPGEFAGYNLVYLGSGTEDNLALAAKLQVTLERQAPGIMRPVNLRGQRFNQDLSNGALLIEMGAAGNTHAEALLAAEQLAQAIITLAEGADVGEGH